MGMIYGVNIMIPSITEATALTNTHPALTSFAYLIFTSYLFDMVSLKASMTLLNASDINTKAIKKPTAIHAVWEIFRKIPSNITSKAATSCILKFLSFLIIAINPCIACF